MIKALTRKNVQAFILSHDKGKPWKRRTDGVVCACDSGNSGYRDTYNNGYYDVFYIEYTKDRTRTDTVPLCEFI